MSQYYIGGMVFGQNDLMHSPVNQVTGKRGGWTWGKHKYIRIENGRYIYPEDVRRQNAGFHAQSGHNMRNTSTRPAVRPSSSQNAPNPRTSIANYTNYLPRTQGQQNWNATQNSVSKTSRYGSANEGSYSDMSVGRRLSAYGNVISGRVNNTITNISRAAQPIISKGRAFVGDIISRVRAAVQNVSSRVQSYIDFATGKELANAQAAFLANRGDPQAKAAYEDAQNRYNNSIFGKAKNLINRIIGSAKKTASNAYGAAKNAASNAYVAAKNAAVGVYDRVAGVSPGQRNWNNLTSGNHGGGSNGETTRTGLLSKEPGTTPKNTGKRRYLRGSANRR